MVADLQLVSGRTLDIVTQAVAKGAYGSSIAADYGRFTVAAAMTETARSSRMLIPNQGPPNIICWLVHWLP